MYKGYLLRIGNEAIPDKYIAESSYYVTPCQIQDLDSYRDNTGILHRTVVANTPSKVEFKTIDGLTNEEMKRLWGIFKRNFTAPEERKAKVTFYVPLDEDYIAEFMYLKNPKPQIDHIDSNTNTVYYKGLQFVLTGY